MTISPHEGGGTVEAWSDDDEFSSLGLEDIDGSDVVIPRLVIQHKTGTFKDSLSGEEFDTLDCVLLGIIKQRIMWPDETEDKDKPLCRSVDAVYGFPQLSDRVSADKRFPFDESSFAPSDARPLEITPRTNRTHPEGWSSNGHAVLPCSSCSFKEWGTNPKTGKATPPPCSEQHTFPLMYTRDGGETWNPAILTLQRTGIKPSRSYISAFAQQKRPLFTSHTRITLEQNKRGSVEYCVPNLQRGAVTDKTSMNEYADRLKAMRSWIRQAPRREDEEIAVSDGSTDPWAGEATAAPTPAPVPAPAPVATPAPAAAAPAPVATPAPVAAPVAPPASEVVIEQPAPAPVAPTPAPAATPATATPPASDDDDLPF